MSGVERFVPTIDSLRDEWGTDAAYIHGLKLMGGERRFAEIKGLTMPEVDMFIAHDNNEQLRSLSRLVLDGSRAATLDERSSVNAFMGFRSAA